MSSIQIKWMPLAMASEITHALPQVESDHGPHIVNCKAVCGKKVQQIHQKLEHFKYRHCKQCDKKLLEALEGAR